MSASKAGSIWQGREVKQILSLLNKASQNSRGLHGDAYSDFLPKVRRPIHLTTNQHYADYGQSVMKEEAPTRNIMCAGPGMYPYSHLGVR